MDTGDGGPRTYSLLYFRRTQCPNHLTKSPHCQQAAILEATACTRCGHQFRTQFKPADHSPVVPSLVPAPPTDDTALRYPILRVKRGFFRSEVVAIYEDHLLKGSCFLRPIQLTEEMCHPSGETALKRHLFQSQSVAFKDVAEIREDPLSSSDFSILIKGGNRIDFSVQKTQSRSIHSALIAKLGDRYFGSKPGSGQIAKILTVFMITFGFLLLLVCILAAANRQMTIQICCILGLSAVALTGGGVYISRFSVAKYSKLVGDPSVVSRPKRQQMRSRYRRKQPFYSHRIGWLLKILGLAYGVALANPMTTALRNHPDEKYAWALIALPIPALIYAGHQLCQRNYDPRKRGDSRKPILFLRPFDDDRTTSFQPTGIVARFAGIRFEAMPNSGGRDAYTWLSYNPIRIFQMIIGFSAGTAEESLVRYFESYGPVVAIGRPGETLPTPGASRIYLSDEDWQSQVLGELEQCQAVVVQPGLSEGVQWELDRIRERVSPYKVLFCLVSYWNDPQNYEELCNMVKSTFHIEMPRVVPFLNRPTFVYFDHGWIPQLQIMSHKCPVLWPLTADATDLKYTLRSFVNGLSGRECEQPRRPRWTSGAWTGLANLAVVIIILALFIGAISIIFGKFH